MATEKDPQISNLDNDELLDEVLEQASGGVTSDKDVFQTQIVGRPGADEIPY